MAKRKSTPVPVGTSPSAVEARLYVRGVERECTGKEYVRGYLLNPGPSDQHTAATGNVEICFPRAATQGRFEPGQVYAVTISTEPLHPRKTT